MERVETGKYKYREEIRMARRTVYLTKYEAERNKHGKAMPRDD